jgi:DNA-binding NtrC family response regulator
MSAPSSRKRILVIDSAGADGTVSINDFKGAFDVARCSDRTELPEILSASSPSVIILDATIGGTEQLALLQELRQRDSSIPVVVLSPDDSVASTVAAMKHGAQEVLERAADASIVQRAVQEAINMINMHVGAVDRARPRFTGVEGDFGALVGNASGMRELFSHVAQIAQRDTTVLITGESGTGKELIAREIHARSGRRDGPFVAINCAAIPESLIESELFGHEKGAFTHAVEKRIGQVELANGGTLFLDEIGELSLAVQVKLLRFLQEQEFYRVGRSKPLQVDIRVITATNRDLEELVRAKQFRQDLLYRINVINLHIPALRERREDIPRLVEHCLKRLAPRYNSRQLMVTKEAMENLSAYSWPGNVRELENVLERLLALTPANEVGVEHLPDKVRNLHPSMRIASDGEAHASGMAFGEAERMFETDLIVRALHKANFVQTRAAKLLGITRRILKYKMDKLGISDTGELLGAGPDKRGRSH